MIKWEGPAQPVPEYRTTWSSQGRPDHLRVQAPPCPPSAPSPVVPGPGGSGPVARWGPGRSALWGPGARRPWRSAALALGGAARCAVVFGVGCAPFPLYPTVTWCACAITVDVCRICNG